MTLVRQIGTTYWYKYTRPNLGDNLAYIRTQFTLINSYADLSLFYIGDGSYLASSVPYTDISAQVDEASIARSQRLFTELQPNVDTVQLRAEVSASLVSALALYDDIDVTIYKDGLSYFRGILSPNYETKVVGKRSWIDLRVEDYGIAKLGRTVTTTIALAGHAICTPSATATSLLHYFAGLAGVTLAAGLPTISATVPLLVILPDDKARYSDIVAQMLLEHGYVYRFNADGQMELIQAVNSGTITTTASFSAEVATGGNIAEALTIKKTREKYDDIRVTFDSLELKSGLTLFQDTTGSDGSTAASIELAAGAYYPKGADAGEVFSEWKSPDGYAIHAATSIALDATIPAGVTQTQALTNYYRRAAFAYRNDNAAPAIISKLKITGTAWIIIAQNTVRSDIGSGRELLERKAAYIFDVATAQAFARNLAHYYATSDFGYSLRSALDVAVGTYVLVEDTAFSGASQKCRVIGRTDRGRSRMIDYELEAVADFASVALITEGTAAPTFSNALNQLVSMASDSIITPQEKSAIMLRWADINGDSATTGSYWQTRMAALDVGVDPAAIDYARGELYSLLYASPAILNPSTWSTNIDAPSGFAEAWANYYRAESETMATISRWTSLGSIIRIDCGIWTTASDDYAPELEGGNWTEYAGYELEDDGGTWSAEAASSATDCGDWSAAAFDEQLDYGDFDAATASLYNPADLILDCGDF